MFVIEIIQYMAQYVSHNRVHQNSTPRWNNLKTFDWQRYPKHFRRWTGKWRREGKWWKNDKAKAAANNIAASYGGVGATALSLICESRNGRGVRNGVNCRVLGFEYRTPEKSLNMKSCCSWPQHKKRECELHCLQGSLNDEKGTDHKFNIVLKEMKQYPFLKDELQLAIKEKFNPIFNRINVD